MPMVYRRKCPHCRKPLAVVLRQPAPPTCTLEAAFERQPDAPPRVIPLPERIERLLRRAGAAGMTVRELQQRLQGPRSAEIKEALDIWVDDGTPPDYDNSTVVVVPRKYGVMNYVWRCRGD